MSENFPQTRANHTRWHPPFHFFLIPGTLLLLVLCVINIFKRQGLEDWILLLIAVMAPVAVLLIRINPLRAQDRLIRLEERLRMAELLDEPLRSRIYDLTEQQIVALRFASDEELPTLVDKALRNKMKPGEIKAAIVTWRADLFRV